MLKTEEQPLVSVVLPVYNRPNVVNTIKSICDQTYNNLEIIVIDNASTDETVACVKKINDVRIKVFRNEQNMGQTYSINRGLDLAQGKYIARIDSDDIALPKRIEKQVRFMEKNPEYVLCGSWIRFISDDDVLGYVIRMPTTNEGLRLMQTISCGMYHPTAFYRKEIIDKFSIRYNDSLEMAEDYDMWNSLLKHGKGLNIPEPLIYYRRGNRNDSRIHQKKMEQEISIIRKRIIREMSMDEVDLDILSEEISIEEKGNQTLIQTFRAFYLLLSYVRKHISFKYQDYAIIRQHIILKIYGTCIFNNNRMYARGLKKVYQFLRDLR